MSFFLGGHHLYMSIFLPVCVSVCIRASKLCVSVSPMCVSVPPPGRFCPPPPVRICVPPCGFLCPSPCVFLCPPHPSCPFYSFIIKLSLSQPHEKSLRSGGGVMVPTYHNCVVIFVKGP